MKLDGRQCKAVDHETIYWGVGIVDPTEPDYVPGKGVPEQVSRACRFVADPNSEYCTKHLLLLAAQPQGVSDGNSN